MRGEDMNTLSTKPKTGSSDRLPLVRWIKTTSLAFLLLVSCLTIYAWLESYIWHRDVFWGDVYRGNYNFVRSDMGAIFLEKRTNCDFDNKLTFYKTQRYGF